MLFEDFIRKKELEEYNKAIEKSSESYADEFKVLGEVNDWPIYHITLNPKGIKRVFFVAGIHGNESGGPYGILEFMKQGMRIPKDTKVEIIPLVNPTGFINKTRENENGVDVDRQFYESNLPSECKFVWDRICKSGIEYLHTLREDPDVSNFCIYYTHHHNLAKGLRDNVAKKYFSILESNEFHNDGLISLPHTKHNTIEDRVLEELGVPYMITETPGNGLLRTRAICNRDIIKYVIHNL
jgi:hypothetical protein